MQVRLLARAITAAGIVLLASTASVHADSILLVDGVEIWRVPGPLAAGETRILPPTDVVVGDFAVIHGLTVSVTNDDGTSGASEIEIESFDWGVGQPPAHQPPDPAPTTVTLIQDFSITKRSDPATVKLFTHCCFGGLLGSPLQLVRIDKRVEVQSRTLDLSDVIVGGASLGGASAGGSAELPAEAVSFNYAKIEWTYTPRTDGGTLKLFDFKSRDRWDLPEPSTIVLCGIGAVALLAHAARASIWRRQPFTEPAARPSTIQRWMKT